MATCVAPVMATHGDSGLLLALSRIGFEIAAEAGRVGLSRSIIELADAATIAIDGCLGMTMLFDCRVSSSCENSSWLANPSRA